MGYMITDEKKLTELVWQELLNKCASDPKKAIRLVMVNKADVEFACSQVFKRIAEAKE
jgi:hypothetical protein